MKYEFVINGLDDDTRKLIDILVCKYLERSM